MELIQRLSTDRHAREFIKFVIVGGLTTAINFTIYSVLVLAGLHYLGAAVIAFVIATLNSYLLNRRWTFRSKSARTRQFIKFLLVQSGGLTVNLVALALLVEFGGFHDHKLIAQLLANALVVVTNFAGNKFWTFAR